MLLEKTTQKTNIFENGFCILDPRKCMFFGFQNRYILPQVLSRWMRSGQRRGGGWLLGLYMYSSFTPSPPLSSSLHKLTRSTFVFVEPTLIFVVWCEGKTERKVGSRNLNPTRLLGLTEAMRLFFDIL